MTLIPLICQECETAFTAPTDEETEPECPTCGSTDYEVDVP